MIDTPIARLYIHRFPSNSKCPNARPFLDFYTSLDPDPLKRGKQFEHFVKWFLKADPEWAKHPTNKKG